jgi:hypothetical protein
MISATSVATEQRLPARSLAAPLRFTLGSFIPKMSRAGLRQIHVYRGKNKIEDF